MKYYGKEDLSERSKGFGLSGKALLDSYSLLSQVAVISRQSFD